MVVTTGQSEQILSIPPMAGEAARPSNRGNQSDACRSYIAFFFERTIGAVRREILDHTLFWNSFDLRRKLASFGRFFNLHRAHSGLEGQTPSDVVGKTRSSSAMLTEFTWSAHCSGLVRLPIAA